MVTQTANRTPDPRRARGSDLGLVDVAQVLEELDRMTLEERLALVWHEPAPGALASTR